MAKVTDQSIPSEDRIKYKRNAQIATTIYGFTYVKKRFPWRLPKMREGGPGVSAAQKIQRAKFKIIKELYGTLSAESKQRWVDANPEYHSYLFGYNFFMLEGLAGGGPPKYPQMIKSIQVVKESVPVSGTKSFTINTIDPTRTVVLIQGNSYISDKVQRGSDTIADGGTKNHALSPNVDPAICEVIVRGDGGHLEIGDGSGSGDWAAPYASALIAAQLTVKMVNTFMPITAGYSWQVIEHKAQTVYPVLVSIAAEAVVIDWAKVPSVAAEVSITVVEYL